MPHYNISDDYVKELEKLHQKKTFGKGINIPPEVKELISKHNVKSILDFGCGKGLFSNSIKQAYPHITLYSYDPVTSPIELPKEVDLVYSSDVLEHVEPDQLDDTLEELFSISKVQFHLIACHPAKKALSDGRNAHLIIEKPKWWRKKISNYLKEGWTERYSQSHVKVGHTKKKGRLEQEKYITILSRI